MPVIIAPEGHKARAKVIYKKRIFRRAGSVSFHGRRRPFQIQVVPPKWSAGCSSETLLISCYHKILRLAVKKGCSSICLPLISSAEQSIPFDIDSKIACRIAEMYNITVYLVMDPGDLKRAISASVQNLLLDWAPFQPNIDKIPNVELSDMDFRLEDDILNEGPPDEAFSEAPSPSPKHHPKCPAKKDIPRKITRAISIEDLSSEFDLELKNYLHDTIASNRTFSQALFEYIDDYLAENNLKDSDFYRKAKISKQVYSNILNHRMHRVSKEIALTFCLALELNLEQTQELISLAGYSLGSETFDVIIRYFIEERKIYDVNFINYHLRSYTNKQLGSVLRK